jgi:RNA polymerase sigma-70 factor (ECF subfamily)
MEPADETLMLGYARGDARAFEALYTRHKGPLFRFVLRSVRSAGEAEELAQEIWMRIVGARASYEPRAKFTTWLYSIAHNRLVDHWRARGLALVSLDGDADDDPPEPAAGPEAEPERLLEASQAARRLAQALAALPFAQREAFLLHQEGGLTAAEIARATGSNEEAAKSRLRYAMKKLKEAIGDD